MEFDRRSVLTAAAAATACTCIGSAGAASSGAAASGAGVAARGWIDVHHHIVPPFYLEEAGAALRAQGGGKILPSVAAWTPQGSLAAMDSQGIQTAMLSISTPGIWFQDAAQAASLARRCNEYAADLVRTHAQRFGLFAALPLPDVAASLAEIAYAFDVLRADGIGLMTSYGDIWPGDPRLAPVLEELNRRKAVVYFHPTAPNCCRNLVPGIAQPMLEFVFDTTRTIASLLLGGAFARYPDIRFIFSHAGGTIPMLAGRIEDVARQTRPDLSAVAPKGVQGHLRELYFDLANSLYPSSWAATRQLIPLSQLLLGSDFPFQPIAASEAGFRSLGISPAEQRAIGRTNALKLFPQIKST
jgi:predicted TIM-barrel fold metal-dependent hydrolase